MTARMLYLHALSPVHSGTGQATDVIDLPVAREKVTNWPYLPGSSLKGVLRDACATASGADAALVKAAFGPDTQHAAEHAGALTFTDAHLLCLPVRSLAGTFAWITCPLALRRWQRDHAAGGVDPTPTIGAFDFSTPAPLESSLLAGQRAFDTLRVAGAGVYLEDLDLFPKVDPAVETIAGAIAEAVFAADVDWRELFVARFGVVEDRVFTFLAETATEVTARVKLRDDTKTVQQGGLWYEEAAPAESIFACPLLAPAKGASRNGTSYSAGELLDLIAARQDELIQVGGSASVGRGLVRFRLHGGGAS